MGQEALAKPSYITHSAIIFAPRAKLFFVLHPLALLLFFLKVVALHIPASKSPSLAMSLQSATSLKTLIEQS
jgi:hypothetical protein